MIDLLEISTKSQVLDVKTGNNYQAAVLAKLSATVHSIERIDALTERATTLLARLGLPMTIMCDDGSKNSPIDTPFDAIAIAATNSAVPQTLLDQLAEPTTNHLGNRLLIPIHDERSISNQKLILIKRTTSNFDSHNLLTVSFVPLIVNQKK